MDEGIHQEMKEAIILASGFGWRLKPHVWLPKPLLKITDKTLLDLQIEWLHQHGFDHIVVTTCFDELTHHEVDYSFEDQPIGTAGGVRNALTLLKTNRAYVMNVDDIVRYNPNDLFTMKSEAVVLCANSPQLPFGNLILEGNLIVGFHEKPPLTDVSVSVGHYTFTKNIINRYFPAKGDIERLVFPQLAAKRNLHARTIDSQKWMTINTVKDLINVRKELAK